MLPEDAHEGNVPLADPVTPAPPSTGFWLFHLYFYPRRFFSHFPRLANSFTIGYSCWILGISSVMDQLDQELLKDEFTDQQSNVAVFMESWLAYWAICGLGGIVAAAVIYGIGGWWYRIRLRWSGAVNPDADLARRVYILASLVYALPIVLLTAGCAVQYASPQAAYDESPFWLDFLAPMVFLYWSIYTSYRGARIMFDLGTWKARTWFLLVPGGFYFLFVGAIGLLVLVAGIIDNQPPDIESPQHLNRPGFSLSYPGNWWIDEWNPDYDPDHYFTIEAYLSELSVTISLFDEPSDPAEAVKDYIQEMRDIIPGGSETPFVTWGDYRGAGLEYTGTFEDTEYWVRLFAWSDDTRSLMVQLMVEQSIRERCEPGLNLIRQSFQIRDNESP